MKTLLVTLDSKFIHANLAVRYLKQFCEDDGFDIEIKEFTINQQIDYILSEILNENPNIICFSCYIWNIEYIKEIAYTIKEAMPDIEILCGGPEVSYETKKFMNEETYVDYVIMGEGELTFKEFLNEIYNNEPNLNIKGLAYRKGTNLIINDKRELICNLDVIKYPYEPGESFEDKIIYYESSRGCPFCCSFCMSSIDKTTRFFSLERVKHDLNILLKTKARQIKFVDRTFNADYKRSMEIMKFIAENNKNNMTVHFEITADIINEEFLNFIREMPVNMFQFEIGVQSLNMDTLMEINRRMNIDHLFRVIREIKNNNNIHIHLDLIAGLPYEDYTTFKESFNGIHELNAEKIQLGFLKVLKGTKIYKDKDKHNIKSRKTAPYEVISTKYLNIHELLKLKKIEELVDKYYNEKYFEKSLNYIIKHELIGSPFDFYEDFSNYWHDNDLYRVSHSRKKLYEVLYKYMEYKNFNTEEFISIMRYDFVFNNQYEEVPVYLDKNSEDMFRLVKRTLSNEKYFREKFFREYDSDEKIVNSFRIVKIGCEATLFIYENKNNIFRRCKTFNINNLIKEYERE